MRLRRQASQPAPAATISGDAPPAYSLHPPPGHGTVAAPVAVATPAATASLAAPPPAPAPAPAASATAEPGQPAVDPAQQEEEKRLAQLKETVQAFIDASEKGGKAALELI